MKKVGGLLCAFLGSCVSSMPVDPPVEANAGAMWAQIDGPLNRAVMSQGRDLRGKRLRVELAREGRWMLQGRPTFWPDPRSVTNSPYVLDFEGELDDRGREGWLAFGSALRSPEQGEVRLFVEPAVWVRLEVGESHEVAAFTGSTSKPDDVAWLASSRSGPIEVPITWACMLNARLFAGGSPVYVQGLLWHEGEWMETDAIALVVRGE